MACGMGLLVACKDATPQAGTPDMLAACGLDAQAWTRLEAPPSSAAQVLQILDAARDAAQAATAGNDQQLWFAQRDGANLAYCEFSGPPECGVGMTAIIESRGEGWHWDEEYALTLCSPQGD